MQFTKVNYSDDKIILLLSVARISFLSAQEKKKLLNNIDSSSSLALMSIEDIENILERSIHKNAIWNGKENLRCAKISAYRCESSKIQIISIQDSEYPEILRQISDPPFLLFYRGDVSVLTGKSVSVVGTRRITPEGKTAAKTFAYNAVLDKCNVVSGLANGVDGYAHQGALDAFFDSVEKGFDVSALGKTIAVLPSAIDEIVPYGHKKMAEQIIQSGGCIISEYEPGMPLKKYHFVGRNRIIAGLSPATVVIEAPAGSGALITADFAIDYNRDVMFHQAAFGNMAEQVSQIVLSDLEKQAAAGNVSQYKIENTPEKFLKNGVPVIKDYNDYCKVRTEVPGLRSIKYEQGRLFED